MAHKEGHGSLCIIHLFHFHLKQKSNNENVIGSFVFRQNSPTMVDFHILNFTHRSKNIKLNSSPNWILIYNYSDVREQMLPPNLTFVEKISRNLFRYIQAILNQIYSWSPFNNFVFFIQDLEIYLFFILIVRFKTNKNRYQIFIFLFLSIENWKDTWFM